MKLYPLAVAGALALHLGPAVAWTQPANPCVIGTRVVDAQQRTGIVMRSQGNDCYVRHDQGEGRERYYMARMLTPVEGKRAAAPAPAPGAARVATRAGTIK